MSFDVLAEKKQVCLARKAMKNRGIDCADRGVRRFLKKRGFSRGILLGDVLKSWDVLKTLDYLDIHIPRQASVLDMGAYACEILPALHKMGYVDLVGIDLNPEIAMMPEAGSIRYVQGDMYKAPFSDQNFQAITAISVVEHGFAEDALLAEVSRLLAPGGVFLASVDYWPQKIDTQGLVAFGLDWTIFSEDEICSLIKRARGFDLYPLGNLDFGAVKPSIKWLGKNYTFAWLGLQKKKVLA